eukprot:3935366-Rhodomonas_salina.2
MRTQRRAPCVSDPDRGQHLHRARTALQRTLPRRCARCNCSCPRAPSGMESPYSNTPRHSRTCTALGPGTTGWETWMVA